MSLNKNMKIATLGWKIPIKEISCIDFNSTDSLLDYDIIIYDTSKIFYEYQRDLVNGTYRGYRNLHSDDSVRILEDKERRLDEMVELMNMGRTLLIFCPPPNKCYIDTGDRKYSGSGRNRREEVIVQDIDIVSFLPEQVRCNTVKSAGEEIDFAGNNIFQSFWEKVKDIISYKAYFSSSIGRPFLYVKGTKKPVGTYFSIEKGHIVFIPHLPTEYDFTTKKSYKETMRTFISAVIELVNNLKNLAGELKLPEWTNAYLIPGEKKLLGIITKQESGLKKLSDSIDREKKRLSKLRQYKLLLCGQGTALKKQVISVFNEIGLHAEEGPEGRDDIVITYGEKTGVVEVKGKSKSAAEKDAAQLEKWVCEYYDNNGVKVKGFLVVNAFCNTPLNIRQQPAFPNQMIPYCKNRNHCLITTIQLLNILLYIKRNPQQSDKTIKQLFKTKGMFENYSNCEDFLETSQTNNQTMNIHQDVEE